MRGRPRGKREFLIPESWSRDNQWQKDALCKEYDPSLWFPVFRGRGTGKEAKEICGRCPVKSECLESAIKYDEEDGIWGGMTRKERLIYVGRRRAKGAKEL